MTFFQTLNLTDFDLIVILLTFLSMIVGFIRGFSREVLSITSWIGSVLISLHLRPIAVPLVKKYITSTFFAEPIAIFIVFFVCFAILAKISQMISKNVKSSVVGIIDRLMGIGFGFLRVTVIFGAAYMVYSTLSPQNNQPSKFLAHSKTLPIIQTSVTLVQILLPQDVVNATQKEFEGWVDHQFKAPVKPNQPPESWPKKDIESSPIPHKDEEPKPQVQAQDTKLLVENLSKINITPQTQSSEITPVQKEKLNRILESY